jgi:hypothetical protein
MRSKSLKASEEELVAAADAEMRAIHEKADLWGDSIRIWAA